MVLSAGREYVFKIRIWKRLERGLSKFEDSQKKGIVLAVMVEKMNEIF